MKASVLESKKLESMQRIEKCVDLLLKSVDLEFDDSATGPVRNRPGIRDLTALELIERKLEVLMKRVGIEETESEPVAVEPEPAAEPVVEAAPVEDEVPAQVVEPEPEKVRKGKNK